MKNIFKNRKIGGKALIIVSGFLAVALSAYIVILPLIPPLQYKIQSTKNKNTDFKNVDEVKKIIEEAMGIEIVEDDVDKNNEVALLDNNPKEIKSEIKEKNQIISSSTNSEKKSKEPALTIKKSVSKPVPNTLLIPKIGVKIPIIESESEEYGLDHGAWKLPKSSTPEESGNMILTGHRFKYLPPSNLTFYLFHKLEAGDIASIIWNNKTYLYRIKEKKVISPDDISVLKQTKTPILTMYTCDPIYSTKNRLVIIAEPIED